MLLSGLIYKDKILYHPLFKPKHPIRELLILISHVLLRFIRIRMMVIIKLHNMEKSLSAGPTYKYPDEPPDQSIDNKNTYGDQRRDPKRFSEKIDHDTGNHGHDHKKLRCKDPPIKCQYDSSEFFVTFILRICHLRVPASAFSFLLF